MVHEGEYRFLEVTLSVNLDRFVADRCKATGQWHEQFSWLEPSLCSEAATTDGADIYNLGIVSGLAGACGTQPDETSSRFSESRPAQIRGSKQSHGFLGILTDFYKALVPRSAVLIRMASSMCITKILPSPVRPVRAACAMAATTSVAISSVTITSSLTLGRKSTTCSRPL